MGLPMLTRLVAGRPVVAFDLDAAARDRADATGAQVASSLDDLSGRCDVVLVMVPSRIVGTVLVGGDGLLPSVRPGQIVIDGGNSDPAVSARHAAMFSSQGASFLDVGFSGGPKGAVAGDLAVMVGGDEHAYLRVAPLLAELGGQVAYFGPSGSGHLAKAINHLVQGLTAQAIGEALAVAAGHGIDPLLWAKTVAGGAAGSWLMDRAVEMLAGAPPDEDEVREWWRSLGPRNQLSFSVEAAESAEVGVPLAAVGHQVRVLSLGGSTSEAMKHYMNLTWTLAHASD